MHRTLLQIRDIITNRGWQAALDYIDEQLHPTELSDPRVMLETLDMAYRFALDVAPVALHPTRPAGRLSTEDQKLLGARLAQYHDMAVFQGTLNTTKGTLNTTKSKKKCTHTGPGDCPLDTDGDGDCPYCGG